MLICIPRVLDSAQLSRFSEALQGADWIDGNATSGEQSARAKCNEQLAEHSALGRVLGDVIQDSLGNNPLFFSAALPHKVFPPLFNRYTGGGNFGAHVDNAIRQLKGTDFRIRTDLSATLFLSDPQSYDGGELVIEEAFGQQTVKLAAGDMVLYPASSVHRVTPVTRGTRTAAFFWIQSMVRDDAARRILFELDQGIRKVDSGTDVAADGALQLTGVYHNLLRRWSDV